MKVIKCISLSLLIILGCGSCEHYLDKEPLGETLLGSITTQEQAVLFVNAAYQPLLWGRPEPLHGHYFNDMWILGDVVSDDTETPVDPNNGNDRALQEFNVFPDNTNLRDWFGSAYVGISRCNLVINSLPDLPDKAFSTAGIKERCLGEVHFLRALYYFDLVKVFGGVPLVLKPIMTVRETQLARATEAETWALIEQDLKLAAGLLPSVQTYRNTANLGRASRGAALALLAKVYLYQQQWDKVVETTEKVIQSKEYALVPDYLAQFNNQTDQNTVESLFEVQAYKTNGWGGGTEISLDFGRWGFNNPTQEFVDEFEPGDPRLRYTVFRPGDDRFGQPYDPKKGPNTATGFLARKYVFDPSTVGLPPNGWTSGEGINYIVLRYADVLLMHAEALVELNTRLEEAVSDLNQIRSRPSVNMPPIALGNQAALRQAVRHERRVELGLEGQRYFDLIRWGSGYATPRLSAQGKANFQYDKHKRFPLPQIEIDLNPLLLQN